MLPQLGTRRNFKKTGKKTISVVAETPLWWNLMCRGNRWGFSDAGSRVTARGAAQSNSARSTSQHARAGRWVTEPLSSHLENWNPAFHSHPFFPAPVKDDLIPCVHGWEWALGFPVQLWGAAKPSMEICWIDGGSIGFAWRSVLACLGAEGENSCCVWGWQGALLLGLLQRWEVPEGHLCPLVLWELCALG